MEKEAQWPDIENEEIKMHAWVDYKDIRVGMRTEDFFCLGPNENDVIYLHHVITFVEYGVFVKGVCTYFCKYSCQAFDKSGGVIANQTTYMGRYIEIKEGDAYFKSAKEAEAFGVSLQVLRPLDQDVHP